MNPSTVTVWFTLARGRLRERGRAAKMSIRHFIEIRAHRNRNRPFLYFEDQVVSYGEFDERVNQVANGLLSIGVQKGDRVSLMLPNVPEFLFAWFGLAKIGAVMVPVNTGFRVDEAGYVVNHSDSVGIIVDSGFLPIARRIRSTGGCLEWISCIDPVPGDPGDVVPFYRFFNIMPITLEPIDVGADDLIQIIYTSGTTGFPKGVMHVHQDMTLTGEAFTLCAGLTSDDRIMVILPLHHANAQYYSVMGALAAEASVVLIKKFSAGAFWEQAVRYGATEFNFVGAVGRILCRRPSEEFRSGHCIKTAYGALVTPDVYDHFTRRFRIPNVIDGYGLTEVPRVSQNPIDGKIKPGSMGLPARHPDASIGFTEVRIVDDEGKETGPGQKGELIVRSPVMMKGYYKDEKKTREAIRNGWFHTGDYVCRDEDGYLFFVDRKKDIIRRKGENISAREIEAVIESSGKAAEVAVIPVPSELGEDEVLACIVMKEGETITPEAVVDLCADRLADFKVPRYIRFRDELPKTSTERIAKHELRKEKNLLATALDMEGYKKKRMRSQVQGSPFRVMLF